MINSAIYIYVLLWPLFNEYVLLDMGAGTPDITVEIIVLPLLFMAVYVSVGNVQFGKFFIWLLLYLLYIFMGLVVYEVPSVLGLAQGLMRLYLFPYVVYFAIFNYRAKLDFKKLSIAILAGGMIIAGVGIAEFLAGENLIGKLDYDPTREILLYRTNGPFHDSIGYASLLLLYVPFAFYCAEKGLVGKVYSSISAAIVSIGSAVNISRAALLSLVVVLLACYAKRSKVFILSVLAVVLVGVPALFMMTDIVNSVIGSDVYQQRTSTATAVGRWDLYMAVVDRIIENPLLGIGPDNYMRLHGGATHNSFLQVTVELGVVGLVLFTTFILTLIMRDLKTAIRFNDSVYVRTQVSIIFVTLFVSNTINLLHSPHYMTALMIVLGCIHAHHAKQSEEEQGVSDIDTHVKKDVGKKRILREKNIP